MLDLLINFMGWNESSLSDFLFCSCVLLSVVHDLRFETKPIDIAVLQRKINFLLRMAAALFCIVIAFAITCPSQFWVPMELEVVQDEELLQSDTKGEPLTAWNFVYGGYYNDNGNQFSSSNDITGSVRIRCLIHGVVGATKFTVVRFLISEAELTVKMLIRIYSGL
ncbi:unnamed protein product [Orchesella dallaii]|uniref:Uncharacterized protein n=1 Tax=Orchesella dallaii TaxID=48710 RepID=A0ABP1QHA0_9HEXA